MSSAPVRGHPPGTAPFHYTRSSFESECAPAESKPGERMTRSDIPERFAEIGSRAWNSAFPQAGKDGQVSQATIGEQQRDRPSRDVRYLKFT
jgi:hypothetical protein